jgi:hypothetical protein
MNLLGAIITPVVMFILLVSILVEFNAKRSVEIFIAITDLAVTLYFTVQILKIIKGRDSGIPDKIIYYMKMIMIFSLVFLAVEIPVILWANDGQWMKEDTQSVRASLQTVITYFVWREYFRELRRGVLLFPEFAGGEMNGSL